jgi:N-methylhydantoinase A/oxoprolinase/acetone carboxylase beta subunit
MTAYDRFVNAYNQRATVSLVDNATVDGIAVGRRGLRKNEYERTRAKIQEVRAAIFGGTLSTNTLLPRRRGGFQARRGLYANHVGGAADSLPRNRPGLYAGLRKRAGPRATARVRQHTSRSSTRRQRHVVDRLMNLDS